MTKCSEWVRKNKARPDTAVAPAPLKLKVTEVVEAVLWEGVLASECKQYLIGREQSMMKKREEIMCQFVLEDGATNRRALVAQTLGNFQQRFRRDTYCVMLSPFCRERLPLDL